MTKLLVVGGGRMGEAIGVGLARSGWAAGELAVVETEPGRREQLSGSAGLATFATIADAAGGEAFDAVVAVKPHHVEAVCAELGPAGARRVLSVAAGITLANLSAWLGQGAVAFRAMPNTPALVGAAASAVSAAPGAGRDDVEWAKKVLGAIGTVVELPEPSLDAVTGLSGSGPAYLFLVAEALIDAGVLVGLARPVARDLAVQMLLGSARLLAETGEEPSALRAAVTSPGGTTAAGLLALERAGVRAAVIDAVSASAARARELGGS